MYIYLPLIDDGLASRKLTYDESFTSFLWRASANDPSFTTCTRRGTHTKKNKKKKKKSKQNQQKKDTREPK